MSVETTNRVVSADIHSLEYLMWRTHRLIRAAEIASHAHWKFSREMKETVGYTTLSYEQDRYYLQLTHPIVSTYKRWAFNEFYALWSIKPEGEDIARQALGGVNLRPEPPTKLEWQI